MHSSKCNAITIYPLSEIFSCRTILEHWHILAIAFHTSSPAHMIRRCHKQASKNALGRTTKSPCRTHERCWLAALAISTDSYSDKPFFNPSCFMISVIVTYFSCFCFCDLLFWQMIPLHNRQPVKGAVDSIAWPLLHVSKSLAADVTGIAYSVPSSDIDLVLSYIPFLSAATLHEKIATDIEAFAETLLRSAQLTALTLYL